MTLNSFHRAHARMLAGLFFAATIVACQGPSPSFTPVNLDHLRIDVAEAREVSYTNKHAGFYYTLTHGSHTSGWQGWHVYSTKILDDYMFARDGRALERSDVMDAEVFPHLFIRRYRDGTRETVALLDSADALLVELEDLEGDTLHAWPLFSDAVTPTDFILSSDARSLYVARARRPVRGSPSEAPPWIGMRLTSPGSMARLSGQTYERAGRFAPGGLVLPLRAKQATLLLVAHDSPEACGALLDRLEPDLAAALARRKERMEAVLRRSFVRTSDARLDKALHWATLSLDALIMHQTRTGIFAGLPWFSNYWGRDTFIALPGATLVTGRYEEASEILRSFAQWQDADPQSLSFGRVPNLVTPSSLAYNTADGTPWFVIALERYYRASGDSAFVRSMIPAVTRSIEGTIARHTDRAGFLTHGDAETWMDAVGPAGPWSPRGNRANDIQSLWYRQLHAAASLVENPSLAQAWRARAERLQSAFIERFIDTTTGMAVDHLNADDSRDDQLRPNQFFVFQTPEFLTSPERAFLAATRELVTVHGLTSLAPSDKNFHPFHHWPPHYVQDAAYHNGIIWTWLAGPWIDAAVHLGYQDLAYVLTENMTRQILDRGAVGTMSELLDALPRAGEVEPRLSGTFSQAWSLAEFVRVFYEDYLGVSLDVPRCQLSLRPRLPSGLRYAQIHVRFGSWIIPVEVRSSQDNVTVSISSPPAAPVISLECDVLVSGTARWHFTAGLPPGSTSEFIAEESGVLQQTGGGEAVVEQRLNAQRGEVARHPSPELARPVLSPNLKALAAPQHRILTHAEIKASNPDAVTLLDRSDPLGDDRGTGSFVYPNTPQLKAGSLDLARIRMSHDSLNTYVELSFRDLSNPGWHPEYGFQLTFVAIAIDADRAPGSGQRALGWNSNVVFPDDAGYERLILIGGGVRVLDAAHEVLGEYLPASGDERDPLGDAQAGIISFALPRDILDPAVLSGRVTILVGAQDDHGGAGLGEFRSVERAAGAWSGGGKRHVTDPNIYDTLIIE